MKIICKGRGKRKTTQLLYTSDTTRVPILVPTEQEKLNLIDESQRLGLNIPNPISVTDIRNQKTRVTHIDKCYVDNAEYVLQRLINMEIGAMTLSDEEKKETYFCGSTLIVPSNE